MYLLEVSLWTARNRYTMDRQRPSEGQHELHDELYNNSNNHSIDKQKSNKVPLFFRYISFWAVLLLVGIKIQFDR